MVCPCFVRRNELVSKLNKLKQSGRNLGIRPLPVIAEDNDGSYFVLAKVADDRVLIQDPRTGKPAEFTKDIFLDRWSVLIILLPNVLVALKLIDISISHGLSLHSLNIENFLARF